MSTMLEAFAAHQAGHRVRAQALCRTVLQIDPDHADALHLLGVLTLDSGDLAQARALLERSRCIRPDLARTHYNLALVSNLQGDVAAAISAYETAIACAPHFAEAHSNLGNLYRRTGRHEDALRAYGAAIRASPSDAFGYCNLATILIETGRYDVAIRALKMALRLSPDMVEAHGNLGEAFRRSGKLREAAEADLQALALRPDRNAYLRLSAAAYQIDAFDVSLSAIGGALALDPTSAELHCYRSMIFFSAARFAEAVASCEAAIALRPDYAEAHVNLALSLLICGNFRRGWEEYVWIWRLPAKRSEYPYLDRAPLWNGEPFVGRRLLITVEQGYGDAIFVARYLPAVKALGGRVIMEVAPALATLFGGLPGIDELRITGTTIDHANFDLQIPLLGLPRAFGANLNSIPATIPYLRAGKAALARWRPRLQICDALRVGIAWAGSPGHVDDRHRSCRLEDFAPLGAIEGIAWFGLQKGRDEQRRRCGRLTLDPLGPEINDFTDTAAILMHLDLVIAVDTSIVHLAGAMGIAVWTLLPFVSDWRWMLARSDSPWYPTMRLFRQPRCGDWPAVFRNVAHALSELRLRR